MQGAGLLVIDGGSSGKLKMEGQLFFRGLILVNGDKLEFDEDGEVRVLGAIVALSTNGTTYTTPELEVDDEGDPTKLYYQRSGIQLALSLLPFKTQSWREITPDVETAF